MPMARCAAVAAHAWQNFRVRLDAWGCIELERAAAARGLEPEVPLNSIGRVVVRDSLIDAVLDDRPGDAAG